MRKISLMLVLMLCAVTFINGCDLFGGSDSPTAPTSVVNPFKLAKMVIPIGGNVTNAVTKSPSRALNDDIKLEFYDMDTNLVIAPYGPYEINAAGTQVTVTGEFKGKKIMVKIILIADTTKSENVILGSVADDVTPTITYTDAAKTITSVTKIDTQTMLATRKVINETASTETDPVKKLKDQLKKIATAITFTADSDINTNAIVKEAKLIEDLVISGDLAAVGTTALTTDGKLAELLKETDSTPATLTTISTKVDERDAVYPTITNVTPASIEMKDVPTTDITITGTGFGTDSVKLVVKLGTVTATNKTVADTSIVVTITAVQAATIVDTNAAVTVTKTVGAETIIATTTKIVRVNAAKLATIAVTPAKPTVLVTKTAQFVATGTYDDATTKVITATVTWAAVGSGTFSATTKGEYTAGTTATATDGVTITATLGTVVGTTKATVITSPLNTMVVTAAADAVDAGYTVQMTATGTLYSTDTADFTNSTAWTVDDALVANIDASSGLLTALKGGSVVVTSTTTGKTDALGTADKVVTATKTITVNALNTIAITDVPLTGITEGATNQFVATGTWIGGGTHVITDTVTWTVKAGSTGAGTFDTTTKGLFTAGTTSGLVTINATLGTVVGEAITGVTGGDPVISAFTAVRDSATQVTLTWTTSYEVTGAIVQYSKKGTFGDGLDISLKTNIEAAAATKTHTVVLTDVGAASEFWRFMVSYQFGENKYDSPLLKPDGQ